MDLPWRPRTNYFQSTHLYRSTKVGRWPQRERSIPDRAGFDHVLRFTVTLEETEPPIWRRIEIPVTYDFWGLHAVAIQDVMG